MVGSGAVSCALIYLLFFQLYFVTQDNLQVKVCINYRLLGGGAGWGKGGLCRSFATPKPFVLTNKIWFKPNQLQASSGCPFDVKCGSLRDILVMTSYLYVPPVWSVSTFPFFPIPRTGTSLHLCCGFGSINRCHYTSFQTITLCKLYIILHVFVGDEQIQASTTKAGKIVKSTLSVILKADDNKAEYRCNATNEATVEPLLDTVMLNVSCKYELDLVLSILWNHTNVRVFNKEHL